MHEYLQGPRWVREILETGTSMANDMSHASNVLLIQVFSGHALMQRGDALRWPYVLYTLSKQTCGRFIRVDMRQNTYPFTLAIMANVLDSIPQIFTRRHFPGVHQQSTFDNSNMWCRAPAAQSVDIPLQWLSNSTKMLIFRVKMGLFKFSVQGNVAYDPLFKNV